MNEETTHIFHNSSHGDGAGSYNPTHGIKISIAGFSGNSSTAVLPLNYRVINDRSGIDAQDIQAQGMGEFYDAHQEFIVGVGEPETRYPAQFNRFIFYD